MLEGKGAFLYVISYIEGADQNVIWPADDPRRLAHAERIAVRAVRAGLTHVCIKVADGIYPYNVRRNLNGRIIFNSTAADAIDDCPAVVKALQARGIKVYGWGFAYGSNPEAEAKIAIKRMNELGLDGWIVNAETHWKTYYQKEVVELVPKGKKVIKTKVIKTFENAQPTVDTNQRVGQLMAPLRAECKRIGIPLWLSSFKFPSSHPSFPFAAFLDYVDGNMPQVYPIGDTRENAHSLQLAQSLREYRRINPAVMIVPTGAACDHPYVDRSTGKKKTWLATPAQVKDFLEAAVREGLQAANIWEWDQAAERHPELWIPIEEFAWPGLDQPVILVAPAGSGDPSAKPVRADAIVRRLRRLYAELKVPRPV